MITMIDLLDPPAFLADVDTIYTDLDGTMFAKGGTFFTDDTGGVEHCSVDNMPVVVDYICDWIGETVGELRETNRLAATRSTDSRA